MRQRTSAIVFGAVVVVCVAQVAWWIVFQVRESNRREEAAALLEAGRVEDAMFALEARTPGELREDARARRIMFASEGAALGILALVGIVFFYTSLVREHRSRAHQQRFLAGATHELKTPLATLRLGIESLERGSLPPERQAAYLRGMVREIDRLERGLTNLLTAAGLESSGVRPQEPGDLASDLRSAIAEFRERIAASDLELELGPIEACPVLRDPAGLRTALHNLLDNAIKYTPSHGTIRIELRRDGRQARLTVADSGCGIERQQLERIFERFWRGDGPLHVGGTGLGLALVREIAAAHGGSVRAASEGIGHGACFTLELPLAEATA